MTDYNLPPADPVRELAHDAASNAVPVDVTGELPTFHEWSRAVDDVAADIEHTLRTEVEA